MQCDGHHLLKQLDFIIRVLEKNAFKYIYVSTAKKFLSTVLISTLKNVLISIVLKYKVLKYLLSILVWVNAGTRYWLPRHVTS